MEGVDDFYAPEMGFKPMFVAQWLRLRCHQPGIHRVQCIGAGGRRPNRHGRRVGWSFCSIAKPVDVYSQKVMSGSLTKVDNKHSSLQVPRDSANSNQSFPLLSQTLRFLGHGSIFSNACGFS
ncbi:hypothetical protein TNCV_4260331 [Trichonephila clavipes]|nr:hypothetical protein TNCV_4260331 [Trichonephila clavipes]